MSGKIDKPKIGGGIVELLAKCTNQAEVIVADADGKVLVGEG